MFLRYKWERRCSSTAVQFPKINTHNNANNITNNQLQSPRAGAHAPEKINETMITTDNLIPQFREYLETTLRRSPRTCAEYVKDLQAFVLWSTKASTPLSIEDVNEPIISRWVSDMAIDNLSAATIRRRLSCIRTFYRWLSLCRSRIIAPASSIMTPRIPVRLVQPADETAVRQYLERPSATDFQLQIKFAVAMMYAAGLRLAEVLALRGSDIDLERCIVHVLGKGNKERYCAFDASFKPLFEYFVGGSLDPLFNHPNEATFRWAIIKAIQANGRGIHPHQLRHLYACRCLENGMPLLTLSRLLGHSSIKTTERYLNVNRFDLATASAQYAPVL